MFTYLLLKNLKGQKSSSGKRRKYAKYKRMSKSLPQPFHIPEKFPECVEEQLVDGNLTAKARKRFMLTVANAVFKYTTYPSKMEYDHVAKQIVEKYPFMGDKKGSHVSEICDVCKIEVF